MHIVSASAKIPNNTTHTVTVPLNALVALFAISDIVITLTSHNSITETDDNWNVQSVVGCIMAMYTLGSAVFATGATTIPAAGFLAGTRPPLPLFPRIN